MRNGPTRGKGVGECYKRKSMMCLQVRERSSDSKNTKHIWLLSVSLSWGAREVGSPCEWRGGARHCSRAMGVNVQSRSDHTF